MANITVSSSSNLDAAANLALNNGETITVDSNATLTINSDNQWSQQAAVIGSQTISSTTGGKIVIDAREVWQVPFGASAGNVPALGTVGTQNCVGGTSAATGEFLGVWATGEWTPRAAATAMPATGYIKFRSKVGTFAPGGEVISLPGGATATSTGSGKRSWLHVWASETSTITVPRLGSYEAYGDWFDLGTTSGANNQVIDIPFLDILNEIWVETGVATGIYEKWGNAGIRWVSATATIDTDARGKYFGQRLSAIVASTTSGSAVIPTTATAGLVVGMPVNASASFSNLALYITAINPGVSFTVNANATASASTTFTVWEPRITLARTGTTTQGQLVGAGRRIRCANLKLSNSRSGWGGVTTPTNLADRAEFLTTAAGVVIMDTVDCAWYANMSAPYQVTFNRVAFAVTVILSNVATTVTMNDCATAYDSAGTGTGLAISNCYGGGTITNCRIHRYDSASSGSSAATLTDCSDFIITDCEFRLGGANSTSRLRGHADQRALSLSRCFRIDVIRPTMIIGRLLVASCVDVNISDVRFADMEQGQNPGTTNALAAAVDCTAACSRIYWDGGFSNFASIAEVHPYNAIFVSSTGCADVEVRGIGTPASPYSGGTVNALRRVITASVTINLTLRRVYAQNLATDFGNIANTCQNVQFTNCWGDGGDTNAFSGVNQINKGCRWTNSATGQNAVYASHWEDIFPSLTAGRIVAKLNEPTDASADQCAITAGTPKFTSTGNIVMPTFGDQVTLTMPYFALGHTSLANIAPTVTGTNVANMTLEFQADTGAGFGAWAALTGANLAAVGAINPATGVRLKIRATTNIANASNALTYIRIDTVTNASAQQTQYPLPPPPTITVISTEASTLLQIFATGTQTVLASATGTTLTYAHAEEVVDIVAQKAGYLPQRIVGVTLSGSPIQAFTMVTDYNYNPSHGLTYGVDASWATNQLTVPTFGPSVRSVYSLMIDAFIVEASLRNTPFNLSMNGPTSLFFINDAEAVSDTHAKRMTGGGVRYLDTSNVVKAEFVGVQSSGVVAGSQAEYEQTNGAIDDARAIGNVNEIIKVYGDVGHGNFDYRDHLQFKVQRNGYRQAEYDIVEAYGNLLPTLYVIPLPMLAIDGLALGDPGITGVTVTKHGSPVSWDAGDGAKDYSVTIEDSGTNSGANILRWLNYFLSLDATFQGADPFVWPEMVLDNGPAFETLRGNYHGAPDVVVGVRVIRTGGAPHPDFTRFQADDGTYGVVPVVATAQVTGIIAGSRLRVVNETTSTQVYNAIVAGTSWSLSYTDGTTFTAGNTYSVRLTQQSGATASLCFDATGTAAASGWSVTASQQPDTVYNALAIDGAAVTGFAADYANDELDVTVAANFNVSDLYAWYVYNLTTVQGIVEFCGGITAIDQANFRINNSVVDIHIDNATATNLRQLDNRRIFRADGAYPVKSSGGGGIDVVWRNTILIAETGVSGLTSQESADLARINSVLNLVEADEYHTGTTVQKRLRGTGTVLLTKNWTGTPLNNFQAIQ